LVQFLNDANKIKEVIGIAPKRLGGKGEKPLKGLLSAQRTYSKDVITESHGNLRAVME